jgi:hypothetical protein
MLFDDDSYDEKDSLTFLWNPVFWGFGPQTFSYNRTSLQKAIIDQMERNNWMGVCCEPNLIFVVCNQFPVSYKAFPLLLLCASSITLDCLAHCYKIQRYQKWYE